MNLKNMPSEKNARKPFTKEYIPYDSIPFVQNFKTDKTSVFPGSWRGSLTAEEDEKLWNDGNALYLDWNGS